jgi:hypothetical protein
MNSKSKGPTRIALAISSFVLAGLVFFLSRSEPDRLTPGQCFEVIGPVFAYGVAENLNSRLLSSVSITPFRLSGPEIVSSREIPIGTVLRILRRSNNRGFGALSTEGYEVELNPALLGMAASTVVLLSQGNQGSVSPLNSSMYRVCGTA